MYLNQVWREDGFVPFNNRRHSGNCLFFNCLNSIQPSGDYIDLFVKVQMEQQLALLPRRSPKDPPTSFKNADKCKFFTNYYPIKVSEKYETIYQYAMDTDIPDDSTEMLYKMVRNNRKELEEKIGLIVFRGKMLWGIKPSKLALTFQIKVGQTAKHDFMLNMTKQLKMSDLLRNPQEAMKIIQFLNSSTKNRLRDMKMNELGQGRFYLAEEFGKNRVGENDANRHNWLNVWRGFRFSILNVNEALYMQIDACSRIIRTENFLESLNGSTRDFIRDNYHGATIVTRYGNFRAYRIEEVDFDLSPRNKFMNERKGCEQSYIEYFKEAYNLKVTNDKQPLIKVAGRVEKKMNKEGKLEEHITWIYLLPEFVSLTGMSDEHVANRDLMQEVANYTKMHPDQRTQLAEDMKNKLNDSKGAVYEIGKATMADGHVLKQPEIVFGKSNTEKPRGGNMRVKGQIMDPAKFQDWVFVYSVGNNANRDDGDADYALDTMKTAAKTYGIEIMAPGFITVKGRGLQAWKDEIGHDYKKNGVPQVVVLYFNNNQQRDKNLYGGLKAWLTNQIKVPCQVMRKRTVNPGNKRALSCASNIVLQINAKLGHPLWEVKTKHPYFREKKVMYGAISISKGKGGYTLAFVGTTNLSLTAVYSEVKIGIKRKEELPIALLENIFVQWAKNFYKANKCPPDVIIMYRQGLSEMQMKKQLGPEVQAMQKMVTIIAEKIKKPNYHPELIFVTANKKINARFFMPLETRTNGKVPKLSNPESGSVIIEPLSSDYGRDFKLVPQVVTQGTCTPTHYQIAYSGSQIPMEALTEFTFEQCFAYFNWQGAVRVPACLQAADKLSKLVGEHIREDINAPELQKKPFYL